MSRRLLSIAGIVAFTVLAVRGLRLGVGYANDLRTTVDAEAALLERARREVMAIPLLRDSVDQLERRIAAVPQKLLGGRDGQLATLDLIRRISNLASAHDVAIDSVHAVPEEASAGKLRRVSVLAHVETDAIGLANLFRALETDPAVGFERFDVVSSNPLASPDAVEVLQVGLLLNGWYRPASADSSGGSV